MQPLLITFDVEEFDWSRDFGRVLPPDEEVGVAHRGLQLVLPVLARHSVRGTFFVTGTFAQIAPAAVHAIADAGHEVAAHGLTHGDDYGQMDATRAVERLTAARSLIAATTGRPPVGIRTPRLRPCSAAVLHAAGFAYDASPHPTWVPGRYNGLRWPRHPWREDGIVRVPISVVPLLRIPVSWIWYRTLGVHLGGIAVRLAATRAPYLHLYFHPWEAADIHQFGVPRWLAVGTGRQFADNLDRLLEWACRDRVSMTIGDFVQQLS